LVGQEQEKNDKDIIRKFNPFNILVWGLTITAEKNAILLC